MLLTVPNTFGKIIDSITGQPVASTVGTSISGHANADTKSNYQELLGGAAVTDDAYGIIVTLHLPALNGNSRAALFDIGVDPANGGSYSELIQNLLISGPDAAGRGALTFFFPLFIRAGTQIGARFQAAAGGLTAEARVRLLCRPSRPELLSVGTTCTTFGADTTNSTGTDVVSGTTSEGSWTQLGSNTTKRHFFWNVGIGWDTGTMSTNSWDADLGVGDGSSYHEVIVGERFTATTGELFLRSGFCAGAYFDVPAGQGVYGRIQGSGAATPQLAAYGVG